MDDNEHPVACRAGEWAACILVWLCLTLTAAAVVAGAVAISMTAWDVLSTPGRQFPIGLP